VENVCIWISTSGETFVKNCFGFIVFNKHVEPWPIPAYFLGASSCIRVSRKKTF
ncbi:hypothetical protein KI387_014102, partial [Taxus chinensis]